MKRMVCKRTLCMTVLLLLLVPFAAAGQSYSENFFSSSYMDPVHTTALWDTAAGTISLHPFNISELGSYSGGFTAGRSVVVGDYAYVTDTASGLRVIDITNPANPVLAGGYYPEGGNVRDVVVEGNFAYLAAGGDGFLIVDITDPSNPTLANGIELGGNPAFYGVAVSGNVAYVTCPAENTIHYFDITNPYSPTYLGALPPFPVLDLYPIKMVIEGDYAYVANGSYGLLVVDLGASAPLSVTSLSGGNIIDLAVSGDYALLVDSASGIKIVSIADPTNPTLVGSYGFPDFTSGISIDGKYAYVTNYNSSITANTNHGLRVLDISDPANPVLIDSYNTPRISFGVTVDGNYAFLADDNAFRILEIAKLVVPPYPHGERILPRSIDEFVVDGHYGYAAMNGVYIFDLSNPSDLQPVSTIDVRGPASLARDIAVSGDYLYTAVYPGGLWVYDISNILAPALAGTTTTTSTQALSVAVAGNYAYVADYGNGLIVYDISDPTHPTEAGYYGMDFIINVAVSGDYVYFTGGTYGLIIVDISNPAFPSLVTSIDLGINARSLIINGDIAYVNGSQIVDISDPTVPVHVGTTGTSGKMTISGEYGFVARLSPTVQVLDLSDPFSPVAVTSQSVPGDAYAVAASGDHLFVGFDSGITALKVFDRSVDLSRQSESVVQSIPVDGGSGEIIGVTMTTSQTGNIQWEVSSNNGDTWDSVTPNGSMHVLSHSGSDLIWRATCNYDHTVNPTCESLQIGWQTAGPGRMTCYFNEPLTQRASCYVSPFIMDTLFVVLEDFTEMVEGVAFKLDFPKITTGDWFYVTTELPPDYLMIGEPRTGCAISFQYPRDASGQLLVCRVIYLVASMCDDCSTPNDPVSLVPYSDIGYTFITAVSQNGMLDIPLANSYTYACYDQYESRDTDGDGIPDYLDGCPNSSAAYFDRNGDGCIEALASVRNVEYWDRGEIFTYHLSVNGAPGIGDGSDEAVIIQSLGVWPSILGSNMQVVYGGTTPQTEAAPFDSVNIITFEDPVIDDEHLTYFSDAVIAVGITTSFTTATTYNGRLYRPGEILDADMLFNPAKTFVTSGGGGIDLASVATHEAGHLFGLSHSALRTSTMYPILGSGTETASLATEDSLQFLKAYPGADLEATAARIYVAIEDYYGDPIAGAAVFAIDEATGDTVACDYTFSDGGCQLVLPPARSYYIAAHPLNGSSAIGYVEPAAVNWLIHSWGITNFLPEYWDQNESAIDHPADRTALFLTAGINPPVTLITNEDIEPPTVILTTPAHNALDVGVDATLLIEFSEAIDHSTLQGNFRLVNSGTGQGVGGSASILEDESLLSFTAWNLLSYSTTYVCSLKTGLADMFGNTLAAPYVFEFTTSVPPPLTFTSLVPDNGFAGSVVVVNGAGFDTTAANNTVRFTHESGVGTVDAVVVSATLFQLVVTVPDGAGTGDVTITVGPSVSDPRTFTLLSQSEVARGYQVGAADLSSPPRSHALLPDNRTAFVATVDGISVVDVDPGSPTFCQETVLPVTGGIEDVAVIPDGSWVYAICRFDSTIKVVDPEHLSIPYVLPLGAEPVSITIDQAGRRAYVPTTRGTVQKWDVQKGSPTIRSQVGVIQSPDPNLRSNIAVDPTGELLFALSGTGKVLIFNTATGEYKGSTPVGPDPRDVLVDPTGLRAYTSDGSGEVTVVAVRSDVTSPINPFKVHSIKTGGSLRKASISPAGNYLFSANRQLNLIDVVDLNPNNTSYRSVVATIPQGVNPVAVDIASNGEYAYSLVEEDQQLVILGVGVGPSLRSSSRPAGPDGTMLVFGGSGLGVSVDTVRVLFGDRNENPVEVQPDWVTGSALGVTTPTGIPSGPVSVRSGATAYTYSNELHFENLGPTELPGLLRLVRSMNFPAGAQIAADMVVSPTGEQALARSTGGQLYFIDTQPTSSTYNQIIKTITTGLLNGIAITPDGHHAYASVALGPMVIVIDCNRQSLTYGAVIDTVGEWPLFPMTEPAELTIAPDGNSCLVHDVRPGWNRIYRIDTDPASALYNTAVDTISDVVSLDVHEMVFHPDGRYCYATSIPNRRVSVIDLYPLSANFRQVVNSIAIPSVLGDPEDDVPVSCAFLPDGSRCLVMAKNYNDLGLYIHPFVTTNPAAPVSEPFVSVAGTNGPPSNREHLWISPRGDRGVVFGNASGLHNIDLSVFPYVLLNSFTSMEYYMGEIGMGFAPDGDVVFSVNEFTDSLHVYDFSGADNLALYSGNNQTGIAGTLLPAPLRIRVTAAGQPSEGVAVTFTVSAGSGYFGGNGNTVQVAATDSRGYAETQWHLGPEIGAQEVTVSADGLSGSPVTFNATAIENPDLLPLELTGVIPGDGAQNVGITTTVLIRFSRAVDVSTINSSSLYLHRAGDQTPIGVAVGFTQENRYISLTPEEPLTVSTPYQLEVLGTITDVQGGTLQNPGSSGFTTVPPPPLELESISPPSGAVQVMIVLAGTGFSTVPQENIVHFNTIAATPVASGHDYIKVMVPAKAITGTVSVEVGIQTSNTLPFTVLEPVETTSDETIATVGTHSATKSLAIAPSGEWAYGISPEGNMVIPIDIVERQSLSGINVGNHPISLTVNPEGTYLYVANFLSNSVSIIDIDPASQYFLEPETTLTVGNYPIDLAVSPDGDRVYVVSAGEDPDHNVDVLDSDGESANFHSVLATLGTGAVNRSVVMTPDGSRLYFGTNTGYIVIDPIDFGVLATIGTGSATKSVTMHPDGGLLFILTTEGEVLIVDILEGSTQENAVLATLGLGSATKSVTMSPDGSRLYLIQEELDVILVVQLQISGTATVIDPDAQIPPVQISFSVTDTIDAGEDPEVIVLDPLGGDLALVANSGPETITFLSSEPPPPDTLTASLEVTPRTLSLKSRGRYVHGTLELGSAFPVQEIDIGSILLQDTIPAHPDKWVIADGDSNGIDELTVAFDRALFQSIMPQGEYVPVSITGMVSDHHFTSSDTIRTIRPTVHKPNGTVVPLGTPVPITWTSPEGYDIDAVDVYWSPDDGENWSPIAVGIPDAGSVGWLTPYEMLDSCRVMVTIYKNGEDIGMGMNQEVFVVANPVAVNITSFEGAVEANAAVLRWTTGAVGDITGFHLTRAGRRDAFYERITSEVIPVGAGAGGTYVFRDTTVELNRPYYYMLEQVSSRGIEGVTGPYRMVIRAELSLEQNIPNPFNPVTTITYTIPERSAVKLAVYDVQGRLVRTLVDERMDSGFKKAVWDGRDGKGNPVASGVYFYRLKADKRVLTRKMVLLK